MDYQTDIIRHINTKVSDTDIYKFLQSIFSKCKNMEHIFRGENKKFNKPLSSALYRQFHDEFCFDKKITKEEKEEKFKLIKSVDKNTINNLFRYFAAPSTAENTLTYLQHYGGITNLIDFTKNINIALFFACTGSNNDEDGHIYLCKIDRFYRYHKQSEIGNGHDLCISPTVKDDWMVSQKTIFVVPDQGHVKEDLDIVIPFEYKAPILVHLARYYAINTESVFCDIHGYIRNHEHKSLVDIILEEWDDYINQAIENLQLKDYEIALEYLERAIELAPDDTTAYNIRGVVEYELHLYDDAILDFNQAIELAEKDATAYNNRGIVKAVLKDYESAIADFNHALVLNSNYSKAHNNLKVTRIAVHDPKRK